MAQAECVEAYMNRHSYALLPEGAASKLPEHELHVICRNYAIPITVIHCKDEVHLVFHSSSSAEGRQQEHKVLKHSGKV